MAGGSGALHHRASVCSARICSPSDLRMRLRYPRPRTMRMCEPWLSEREAFDLNTAPPRLNSGTESTSDLDPYCIAADDAFALTFTGELTKDPFVGSVMSTEALLDGNCENLITISSEIPGANHERVFPGEAVDV